MRSDDDKLALLLAATWQTNFDAALKTAAAQDKLDPKGKHGKPLLAAALLARRKRRRWAWTCLLLPMFLAGWTDL
ncbi:MAG: hypothetical protein ACYTEG_01140 [Planctomycetota bacterium]